MWIVTAIRYCGQAIMINLFGKVIGSTAGKIADEVPKIFGFGKYRVDFVMDTPQGTVETCARFPFFWCTKMYLIFQAWKYSHIKPLKFVYATEHGLVQC